MDIWGGWLGIAPEGWFVFGSIAVAYAANAAMKAWEHYHPIKWAWCSGCDELQPSACFRWNKIGLYRCGNCIEEPKLLDQAKALKHEQAVPGVIGWPV